MNTLIALVTVVMITVTAGFVGGVSAEDAYKQVATYLE